MQKKTFLAVLLALGPFFYILLGSRHDSLADRVNLLDWAGKEHQLAPHFRSDLQHLKIP